MTERENGARAHVDLFRYLTSDDHEIYVAIMDTFVGSLLTELSANAITDLLADAGVQASIDTVDARCAQLVEWGNLVLSTRDAHVDTVADYRRARARYQASSLGGRVHRDAVAVLGATDGAREVAREVLGRIADALQRIASTMTAPAGERDDEALAGYVTTAFTAQDLFTSSVTDFYAYLAEVLGRSDPTDAEHQGYTGAEHQGYAQFKALLLDYVDLITADVNRHSPVIAATLDAIDTDALVAVLAEVPSVTLRVGTAPGADASPGRTTRDWDRLRAWYAASGDHSGPAQLRAAAGRALGELLAGAKRMLDTSHTGYSRRADLLRLASWFDDAADDEAERLFAATFGAYPTRHLLLGPDEPDPRVGSGTSWWYSEPIDVPVSLRDRGDRVSRGRVSRVPDPTADRRRIGAVALAESRKSRDAALELVDIGALSGARLSPTARGILLDRLARLLATQDDPTADGHWDDGDLGIRVVARRGGDTVVHGPDGVMTIHGLIVTVEGLSVTSGSADAPQPRRTAR